MADGHNVAALVSAYDRARRSSEIPTVALAKTFKGRGIPCAEGKDGWHGKPIPAGELADSTLASLRSQLTAAKFDWRPRLPAAQNGHLAAAHQPEPPPYVIGGPKLATRKAYGESLEAVARTNPRVVGVDGDVGNSALTTDIAKTDPKRLLQCNIAERNLVGAAMGLACRGKVPFASSFACFLARGCDFMRLAAISSSNVKLVGTDAGVSVGEDGASQMGLEDRAMACAQPNYTVFYRCDATSAWRTVQLAAGLEGPVYIRTSRPKTDILYDAAETFEVGKAKVLRSTDQDDVAIVASGVTLYEALETADRPAGEGISAKVIDLLSVQPIDRSALAEAAEACHGRVLKVEDQLCPRGNRDRRAGGSGGPARVGPAAGGARDRAQRQAGSVARPFRHPGAPHRGGRQRDRRLAARTARQPAASRAARPRASSVHSAVSRSPTGRAAPGWAARALAEMVNGRLGSRPEVVPDCLPLMKSRRFRGVRGSCRRPSLRIPAGAPGRAAASALGDG